MASCPRCQGTGTCVECQGTGKVLCPNCDGKGECVTPRGMTYPCKPCHGTGQMDCALKCSSCEGTGAITEKLQKNIRDIYSLRFANFTPLSRLTVWLGAVNLTLFAFTQFGPLELTQPLEYALRNDAGTFSRQEFWKLVTPVLLHVGWLHVALNSWFLISYCPGLEGIYGSWRFLGLYLVSAACGNLFSYAGYVWIQHDPHYASMGASTALFGVGAAYIALHWRYRFFSEALVRNWGLYLGGYVLAGFASAGVPMLWFLSGVDNWGHLGGAVGGILYVYLAPRPRGH
ncbi:MAG: rhomboid family intramembrane serine protease [Candidatus Eremiobacterota bacterium]